MSRPNQSLSSSLDTVPLIANNSNSTSYEYAVPTTTIGYQSTTTTTATTEDIDDAISEKLAYAASEVDHDDHRTTVSQTLIHLVKGYIGVGLLSLPWAISQLGIPFGVFSIFLMSYWSSYNCWTVVRVKRFIEQQRSNNSSNINPNNNNRIDITEPPPTLLDDALAVATETASDEGSATTANTNMTYPDVGEWAYGKTFQSYVSGCIITQQLAICTVFISFIGENLNALLKETASLNPFFLFGETHAGALTIALPFCLSLGFIPSLRALTPIMAGATLFLLATFVVLSIVGSKQWSQRPEPEDRPTLDLPASPLALCAILYSFEGICLILPIESAMKEPQHFGKVFCGGMTLVAIILALFSAVCVFVFGSVTNGSITAFLIHKYQTTEPALRGWLLLANTTVSLSIWLTYPLQLFPAIELLGPSWSKRFGGGAGMEGEDKDEKDLTGFDPLPPLPEDGVYVHEESEEEDDDEPEKSVKQYNNNNNSSSFGAAIDPSAGGDNGVTAETVDDDKNSFKGLLKRAGSSLGMDDDAGSVIYSVLDFPNQMMPKMILPGDSPQLRAFLVVTTYFVAVIVPNLQQLISLAGALAGSSSALLIPPVLELAWLNHLEQQRYYTKLHSPNYFLLSKWKCYFLFVAGFIFMLIGTYQSLTDIIAVYTGRSGEKKN